MYGIVENFYQRGREILRRRLNISSHRWGESSLWVDPNKHSLSIPNILVCCIIFVFINLMYIVIFNLYYQSENLPRVACVVFPVEGSCLSSQCWWMSTKYRTPMFGSQTGPSPCSTGSVTGTASAFGYPGHSAQQTLHQSKFNVIGQSKDRSFLFAL